MSRRNQRVNSFSCSLFILIADIFLTPSFLLLQFLATLISISLVASFRWLTINETPLSLHEANFLHPDEDDCSKRGRGARRKVSRPTRTDGRFIDCHGLDIGKAWITKISLSIPAVERLRARIDVESSAAISIRACPLTALTSHSRLRRNGDATKFPDIEVLTSRFAPWETLEMRTVNIRARLLAPIYGSFSRCVWAIHMQPRSYVQHMYHVVANKSEGRLLHHIPFPKFFSREINPRPQL